MTLKVAIPQASVEDLKAAISKANAKYYPSRQRLTLTPEPGQRSGSPLLDGKALSEYNLTDGSTVIFKDLGTQASRTELHAAYNWNVSAAIFTLHTHCRSAGQQSFFGNTVVP